MADQLLVRLYNVGLGDFIYLRVPDRRRTVHIVIDCGNKFGSFDVLERCIQDLKNDLPTVRGKKRLDLLVVTHPHEDHHKGFDPALFDDVRIERIWLSPAFNRADPNAQAFHALQDAAARALQSLTAEAVAFSAHPPNSDLLNSELPNAELPLMAAELLALSRDEAISALCHTLPEKNGIEPLYVSADTSPEKLKLFRDPRINLKVLGPMGDIDGYYLGGAGLNAVVDPAMLQLAPRPEDLAPTPLASPSPSGTDASAYASLFPFAAGPASAGFNQFSPNRTGFQPHAALQPLATPPSEIAPLQPPPASPLLVWSPSTVAPQNISSQDFKRLQDHVRPNALAVAEVAGHAVNNLSVILLLDWHGRRLLFPGDAEWREAEDIAVKPGRCNGSWNVMWHARRAELSQPLDFLKIGHHGSENATPWRAGHPISVILDALLPIPASGQPPIARAVASTRRTSRWPSIPNPALMAELGRRVANTRREYVEPKAGIHVPDGVPQPQRTDLESQATGNEINFIELSFSE